MEHEMAYFRLQQEIENFLYEEADLLDQRRPGEWLDRLAAARPSVATASEVEVGIRFSVYQNRVATETCLFAGRRNDLPRRDNASCLLARREILLDQNALVAKKLILLF